MGLLACAAVVGFPGESGSEVDVVEQDLGERTGNAVPSASRKASSVPTSGSTNGWRVQWYIGCCISPYRVVTGPGLSTRLPTGGPPSRSYTPAGAARRALLKCAGGVTGTSRKRFRQGKSKRQGWSMYRHSE